MVSSSFDIVSDKIQLFLPLNSIVNFTLGHIFRDIDFEREIELINVFIEIGINGIA